MVILPFSWLAERPGAERPASERTQPGESLPHRSRSSRGLGGGPVALQNCSPYRRKRESKEKHRGQKHCRCIDSPVTAGQAAGEDVSGVECRVADEPRSEPEVDRIAAVEVGRTPPEAGPEDDKGDADIADAMRIEGSRVWHARRQVPVP